MLLHSMRAQVVPFKHAFEVDKFDAVSMTRRVWQGQDHHAGAFLLLLQHDVHYLASRRKLGYFARDGRK